MGHRRNATSKVNKMVEFQSKINYTVHCFSAFQCSGSRNLYTHNTVEYKAWSMLDKLD